MRINVNRNVFNDRKNVSATIVGSAYVYPLDTRMRRNVNRTGFNNRKNVSATARLPYRRDVTVLLWRVFRFAGITVSRSRMLATDASFFSVISTASRWDLRLWRQWGEGMWAYVSIEPAVFNFVRHRAHCNAGLLFFLRCLRPVKIQRHVADDFWQHYWPTRPDDVKIGDAKQSFDSGWRVVLSSYFIYITCWGRWWCRPITGRIKSMIAWHRYMYHS